MKTKKYKICSGLAFADQEDMEMLHEQALQGWVFRELRYGIFYVLYKEEPKDLVFSYDLQKVQNKDKAEYLAFFETAGWMPISKWDKGTHFFMAKSGTVPVHSEIETSNEQYRPVFITASITFFTGVAMLVATVLLIYRYTKDFTALAILSGAAIGGGGIMMIGSYMRVKGKRLQLSSNSYRYQLLKLIVGSIILCLSVRLFVIHAFDTDIFTYIYTVLGLWFLLSGCYGCYRVYKIKKEKGRIQHD